MLRHTTSHQAPGLSSLCLTAVATFAWLASAASITHAAPISYSESVGGDLPEESLPVFTLGIGVNTVSGTCGFSGVNDYDSFAFIVPADHQVTSGLVVMTDAEGEFVSSAWALGAGSAEPFGGTRIGDIVTPSPGSDDFPATPLGPSSYNVTHGTFTSMGAGGTGNYTFSLTVIPEPASAGLLALAGIAWVARRPDRHNGTADHEYCAG